LIDEEDPKEQDIALNCREAREFPSREASERQSRTHPSETLWAQSGIMARHSRTGTDLVVAAKIRPGLALAEAAGEAVQVLAPSPVEWILFGTKETGGFGAFPWSVARRDKGMDYG